MDNIGFHNILKETKRITFNERDTGYEQKNEMSYKKKPEYVKCQTTRVKWLRFGGVPGVNDNHKYM